MNKIKRFFLSLLLIFVCFNSFCLAQDKDTSISPICSKTGNLICPENYVPDCIRKEDEKIDPRCVFYMNKYMPFCAKFAGIKKIDLGLEKLMLSPSTMIKVIGGGEAYTLNNEIIFCKRI